MSPAPLLTRRRWLAALVAGSAVVGATVLVALVANPLALQPEAPQLPLARALEALCGRGDDTARLIVWHARAPRVLLAALVGAGLAQAGALLQLLLRNPLADPFVLGVSSAAALAAVLGLALGLRFAGGGHPAAAAVGALAAALLVHRLARTGSGRLDVQRMVLAGVVLSYLFAAGVMWVVSLATAQEGQRYLFWLMGSVDAASGLQVAMLLAVLLPVSLGLLPTLPALNLLAVSEEHAADAGVPVERVKAASFAVAAALTGATVAVAGSIGFVGIVVPHAVRLVAGSDARLSVPLSGLAGAAFLVLVDLGCRAAGEIPLGVVTATLGAPFFLVLLVRSRPR